MDTGAFLDNLANDASKGVGNIEKAVLVIKPQTEGDLENHEAVKPQASKGFFSSVADVGFKDAMKEVAENALNSALDALSNEANLKGAPNTFLVQFNPSTVSFDATGELITKSDQLNESEKKKTKTSRKGGSAQFLSTNKVNIKMNVDLIFEDIDVDDAFLENKLSPINGEFVQSVGKSLIKTAGFGKKNHSVREQVQALTHVARTAGLKRVEFNWGKTSFIGTLNSLRAEYTMFSPKGEPIYAKVHMELVLYNGHGYIETWDQIYRDAFGDGTGYIRARELGKVGNATSSLSSIGNITF